MVVGDFGCGSGSLGYHLSNFNLEEVFELVDYNQDAVDLASDKLKEISNIKVSQGNLEQLTFADNHFDYIFCWQTLSWLSDPEKVMLEMIRVLKPDGKLYMSALVNVDHDVDLHTEFFDYTRGADSIGVFYNTYSKLTLEKWLKNDLGTLEFSKFTPDSDFYYDGRGLGSFTVDSGNGKLQISAGMLMNWYFITFTKSMLPLVKS